MASFPHGRITLTGITRGRQRSLPGAISGCAFSLSTDAVGMATVTFSGVNSGSEIRAYLPDTTEAAGIETCSADQVLSWSVYSAGSPNNTVRIVIVHPDYKIKEFTYTASLGNQSIPVQQEPDKWYSNPA